MTRIYKIYKKYHNVIDWIIVGVVSVPLAALLGFLAFWASICLGFWMRDFF